MTIDEMIARKKELRLTNVLLSSVSGVPLGTVQKVFSRATASPRYETLQKLEKALGKDGGSSVWETRTKEDHTKEDYTQEASQQEDHARKVCVQEGRLQGSPAWQEREKLDYGSAAGLVREGSAAYAANRGKRQGEYTLEDYYALPDDVRSELIDGAFFLMSSPSAVHQLLIGQIYSQLLAYITEKGGNCIPFIAPMDVQLDCDDRTILEPDVMVVCDRSKITQKCISGAPDLVIEILSPSTIGRDLTLKAAKYQMAGVREYWIVDPRKKIVIVYLYSEQTDYCIYGFDSDIPVYIFGGECQIRFSKIGQYIRFLENGE